MARTRTGSGGARKKTGARRGRPAQGSSRQRRRLVLDLSLLEKAMRVTGRNESETVNEALARLAENAAIVEGIEQLGGAFPDHPDH